MKKPRRITKLEQIRDAAADEAKYTERDLILAKRETYANLLHDAIGWSREGAERKAATMYPFPKTTRPRVVSCGDGFDYRYRNGVMERRHHTGGGWERTRWSVDEFRRVADLLANPTEEVPE